MGRLAVSLGLGMGPPSGGESATVETYASIGVAGDSHGYAIYGAMQYAQATEYPADILIDDRAYADGGMSFYTGGATSSTLLNTHIPQVQARPPEILIVSAIRNPGVTNQATADTAYDNIVASQVLAQAAGVKLFVVLPGTPDNALALSRTWLEYLHARLVTWAAADPTHRRFFNIFSEWINAAELTNARWNLATDALGSYTYDNVHGSLGWWRALAPHFADLFADLALPLVTPTPLAVFSTFDPATSPVGHPINGTEAFMAGTGGKLNTVNNAGVAGTIQDGGGSRYWSINSTNGAIATPTKSGANQQQIVLSGTPSADAMIEQRWDGYTGAVNGGDSTKKFVLEAQVSLVNVTGLYGFELVWLGLGMDSVYFAHDTDARSEAHRFPDNYTEDVFLRSGVPLSPTTEGPTIALRAYFKSGVAISGTIRINSLMGLRVA